MLTLLLFTKETEKYHKIFSTLTYIFIYLKNYGIHKYGKYLYIYLYFYIKTLVEYRLKIVKIF